MSKTDIIEIDLLKWFTGQAVTYIVTGAGGATVITPYIALFTAAPTDAGGGTEVTGNGYARVSSAGKWAVPSAGSVANNAAITFGIATGSYTVIAFALMDASTAGNMLRWAAITSKTIQVNDTPNFPTGSLTFTED